MYKKSMEALPVRCTTSVQPTSLFGRHLPRLTHFIMTTKNELSRKIHSQFVILRQMLK